MIDTNHFRPFLQVYEESYQNEQPGVLRTLSISSSGFVLQKLFRAANYEIRFLEEDLIQKIIEYFNFDSITKSIACVA